MCIILHTGHGYIYLSKDAVSIRDYLQMSKDHVYVTVFHIEGTQEEGKIEQLNTNPNQDLTIYFGQLIN